MMVWKYASLLELFHLKKSVKFVIKVKSNYIGMTVHQFSETKVVLN